MCPLQQFRRLLEDNMLSAADREAACARPSISRDNLVVILTGVVMVLAVTAAVLVFNVFRSRQRRQRFTSNLRYQQLLQNTADDDTDDDVSVQRLRDMESHIIQRLGSQAPGGLNEKP
nr:hypothetical protein BaRGS_010305 [Batillaria attramentaria]